MVVSYTPRTAITLLTLALSRARTHLRHLSYTVLGLNQICRSPSSEVSTYLKILPDKTSLLWFKEILLWTRLSSQTISPRVVAMVSVL